jgi:AcrR family transcriptional regulator
MRPKKQLLDRMRKSPSQERAQETVKIIFEAAARILERDGWAAFNTNAVAELAGISIGTLYHYFQNKDAILIAMARREMQAHQAAVTQAVSDSLGAPHPVRAIVKALMLASGQRLRARQIAIDTLIMHGLGMELATPLQAVAQVLEANAALIGFGPSTSISATTLFVLTRAVNGVISSAVREGSPLLTNGELEDELVRMIAAYLAAGQVSPTLDDFRVKTNL